MTAHRARQNNILDEVTFIEVLFSGASRPRTSHFSGIWHPPTDVYETEDAFMVQVEVPGVRAEDFSISLSGRRLVVSGVRYDHSAARRAYHQMEIHFGEFRADIDLPGPVAETHVDAEYRDGLLRITLPKPQNHFVTHK